MEKISVRNAKFAKIGLHEMCQYIKKFKDTKVMTIVELGSYAGDAAEIFANYFRKVICVDPWENDYDDDDASSWKYPMILVEAQFDRMKKNFQNITKIKDKSVNIVDNFPDNSLDVVYVDAVHKYKDVQEDIKMWFPKLKEKGWLCGHDYKNKHHPDVEKAIHDLIGFPEKRFPDTSWVINKFTILSRGIEL